MSRISATEHGVGLAVALTLLLPSLRAVAGPIVPVAVYVVPLAIMGVVAALRRGYGSGATPARPTVVVATLLVAWVSWMALSAGWSRSAVQVDEDLELLLLLLAYGIASAWTVTPGAVEVMVRWVVGASTAIGVFVIAQYAFLGDLSGYTSIVYDYYLTISLLIALGCVASAIRLATSNRRPWFWGGVTLFLMASLGLALARGVLVFVMLVVSVSILYVGAERFARAGSTRDRFHAFLVVLAPAALLFTMLAAAWNIERTRVRLLRMFSGDELSEGGRGALWGSALDAIQEAAWWGHGLGSSGLVLSGVEGDYPHNIVMQSWMEGGVIGAVLVGAFLFMPFVLVSYGILCRRLRLSAAWLVPTAMLAILVLEHLKSEHAYTARSIAVVATCAVVATSAHLRERGVAP